MLTAKKSEDCWIVRFRKVAFPKLRLFCFHYGGGGASAFRDWHEYLPNHVEVNCIQLPGREGRFAEPLNSDLIFIVEELTSVIQNYLTMPYVFFGHSVGAFVAHHLISSLDNNNLPPPIHFIPSGRSAPQDQDRYYRKLVDLPDAEFLEGLKEYDGTPDELLGNEELMSIYLPIIRSDFLISESIAEVQRKIPCQITVFGGMKDGPSEEKLALWKHETTKTCRIVMFPGGHFFLHEDKTQVLQKINEIISVGLVQHGA